MVLSTSIDILHKVVDGFHVFEAEGMPGLYIAHRDPLRAYNAVAPALEKLIELDTGVTCKAVPEMPFKTFVSKARAELTCAATRQRFNLFKEAA